MSLGQIPAGTHLNAYWKLDDASDASGNAQDLTNTNTVSFVESKFVSGALFPTSSDNKRLSVSGATLFSALSVSSLTISFWFKLESSTTSGASGSRFFEVSTLEAPSGVGMFFRITYGISAGVMTITPLNILTTTNAIFSYTGHTPDTTTYHNMVFQISGSTIYLYIDGNLANSNTGSGDNAPANVSPLFAIGNNILISGGRQSYAIIDEMKVEEKVWSASDIKRYYTQAKGRFAI